MQDEEGQIKILDTTIDFFMNWIAGLPVTLGQRCSRYLRPVFLLISLVWVPLMFILFLPLLAIWCFVATIQGMWELINDPS